MKDIKGDKIKFLENFKKITNEKGRCSQSTTVKKKKTNLINGFLCAVTVYDTLIELSWSNSTSQKLYNGKPSKHI